MRVKRQRGSHRLLARPEWADYEFTFHDQDEIGPRMLARVAKHTVRTSDWPLCVSHDLILLKVTLQNRP